MSTAAVLLWIINVVLDTVGHLAFKTAAISEHETEWGRWKTMLSSPVMWLGLHQTGSWFPVLSYHQQLAVVSEREARALVNWILVLVP